jgi:hypothetical protein
MGMIRQVKNWLAARPVLSGALGLGLAVGLIWLAGNRGRRDIAKTGEMFIIHEDTMICGETHISWDYSRFFAPPLISDFDDGSPGNNIPIRPSAQIMEMHRKEAEKGFTYGLLGAIRRDLTARGIPDTTPDTRGNNRYDTEIDWYRCPDNGRNIHVYRSLGNLPDGRPYRFEIFVKQGRKFIRFWKDYVPDKNKYPHNAPVGWYDTSDMREAGGKDLSELYLKMMESMVPETKHGIKDSK